MPQPLLFRLTDKAVFDYKLIEPGDRILAAASGGKDSTAMIEYLANRRRRPSADFDLRALYIQSEFGGAFPPDIARLFEKWEVPLDSVRIDVTGRLKSGRKMNCFWCSTQRRTELLKYAVANGFNKLALGHHMDDILETFVMNALEKGTLSAMPPRLSYRDYPVVIIRPLCYAAEETVVAHAAERGYIGWTCSCGFADKSARLAARRRLDALTDGGRAKKERLFRALKHIEPEYLP